MSPDDIHRVVDTVIRYLEPIRRQAIDAWSVGNTQFDATKDDVSVLRQAAKELEKLADEIEEVTE